MLVESFDTLPKQKGIESVDFIFRQIKNKVNLLVINFF